MGKREKLGSIVSGAGKAAKNVLDNAAQAADQNDDGKFNLADVSAIAESVGSTMKKGAMAAKESTEEKARQLERKALQPVFPDTLDGADFLMPKFIRIVDRSKKYAESEVCQGSIGHGSDQKGLHIINIFRDSIASFGLEFYPNCDAEFYYADPIERDKYIALDEYFNYLKLARINELKRIAQDLGAKHFKITYKEEQTSFSSKKINAREKTVGIGSVDAEHRLSHEKYSTVNVVAETSFPGHEPIRPQLKYLQRDQSIQTLVAMRMDERAPLLHEKLMLKMSSFSGMKEEDAVKIDAVLKGLKCIGNTTVANEAQNESRRYFEYDIQF